MWWAAGLTIRTRSTFIRTLRAAHGQKHVANPAASAYLGLGHPYTRHVERTTDASAPGISSVGLFSSDRSVADGRHLSSGSLPAAENHEMNTLLASYLPSSITNRG